MVTLITVVFLFASNGPESALPPNKSVGPSGDTHWLILTLPTPCSWVEDSMMSGSITLQRREARYNLNTGCTYTAEQIAQMFQVSPSSVWLRDRFGTRVFLINTEGTFDFSEEDEYNHLDVEGGTLSSSPIPQTTVTVFSISWNSSNHFSRGYPGFSSVVNQFGGRRQGSGLTLKVIQAKIIGRAHNGRPSFQVLDQISFSGHGRSHSQCSSHQCTGQTRVRGGPCCRHS